MCIRDSLNSTIDGVSGATITSDAVKQCMNDCITQACLLYTSIQLQNKSILIQ